MKKIDDWIVAGIVAGIIGGICHLIYNACLLLIGIKAAPFWIAVGGLFYDKKLITSWYAQLHGMLDAIGISAANGVLTCFALKVTGKKYLYIKSIFLSASSAYFLFLVVYPQTGLGKESPIVPWVALFGHTIFNGWLIGYSLNKIYSFNEKPKIEVKLDTDHNHSILENIHNTSSLIESKEGLYQIPRVYKPKERKVRFIKPKKLR